MAMNVRKGSKIKWSFYNKLNIGSRNIQWNRGGRLLMYNHQIMQHPNPVPEGDNQTFLKFIHNHS